MKLAIKRRRLGKTDLKVTELSFGAMNLRLLDNMTQAYDILNYVLDQKINLIDTARAYNGENKAGQLIESEVLVGDVIKNRNDLTEPIIIITKHHGYQIADLEKDLETSLDKLKIRGKTNLKIGNNKIKLVHLFHGINQERWATIMNSGALERAQELKKEGLVNYIGFSSHYAQKDIIKEALDTDVFDVVELPYNVYNRSLGEDGKINLLKYAYDKDVGIINMKAFNGNGMVELYNILKEIVDIDYGKKLNFCLSNPYITTVDAGAKYIKEFKLDLDIARSLRLSDKEKKLLTEQADQVSPLLKDVCRECMHCLEKFKCVKGINFPGILATYSRFLVSNKLGKETDKYKREYSNFKLTFDECIECGECLPWCEYKLNIPEMLKKAAEKLS